MKVLIFGASGLLGQALMPAWSADEAVGLDSNDGDVRDPQRVLALAETHRPAWIVLAAAYTDVDGCETNPELALAVNRDGAVNVARAAKKIGARLLFVSSDYVFDGRKRSPYETGDARSPINVYGRSKAEAEVQVMEAAPNVCIVRTSWLFGAGGKCFPQTIMSLAATRSEIEVVNDQRGSPTYVHDLAGALVQLCRKSASGIVHATNSGNCTWYDFAREIVELGAFSTNIRPVSSEKVKRPAPRPAYSVLSPASLGQQGLSMPAWQDALARYLAEVRPDRPGTLPRPTQSPE